jgi:4-hydroxybenzoate polyprenyltransferase
MGFSKSVKAWLRLTRIEHSFIAAFAVIAAEALVSKRIEWIFLVPALAAFFITAASFAANDYYDYKSDKTLKRKDRPLVSGEIKPPSAFYAAAALYVLGIALAAMLPTAPALIALAYAAVSVAYSAWLKRLPLVGNVFIASAMAVSFLFGNLVVAPRLNYFVVVFAFMSFFAGLGREFLITLRDVAGDKKIGALTLPMIIGAKRTVILANSLIYVAIILSFFPVVSLGFAFLPFAALIIAADALFVAVVLKTSLDQKPATLRFARNASLWALLVGTLAFASLAFA